MSDPTYVAIGEEERRQSCSIHISDREVTIYFNPPLQEGPHKVTRLETMAAGALLGIARTLTGRGEDAVLQAMTMFDKKVARTKR